MPFAFKLHDPPCDVAFLSIVDGEALYNADNARTRDVKEATIRQIGWHRVLLPQDWFLSGKALETTTHVLEAMQCTVQYLKYRCKNEEKRNIKLTATLQHCEEERAAAFEELIELRETVALYKKKLREMSGSNARRDARDRSHTPAAPRPSDGLPCAFCENVYPRRHALESHFRKRHKRPPGYAAMAAASAAVNQQQIQQERNVEGPATAARPSNLPFMYDAAPTGAQPPAVSTPAPDSRGDRSLREELSELRLTVAKLVTQQAEFYRGMAPANTAAVPVSSAAAALSGPTVMRAATARGSEAALPSTAADTVAFPALLPFTSSQTGREESVLLRIQRELLHTSAELQQLQDTLERGDRRDDGMGGGNAGRTNSDAAVNRRRQELLSSPPPREVPAAAAAAGRPTLDPQSFLRSSASDNAGLDGSGVGSTGGAGGAGGGGGRGGLTSGADTRRASTVDSFVVVSPMSPSPPMAAHRTVSPSEEKNRSNKKQKVGKAEAVPPSAATSAAWTAFVETVAAGGGGHHGDPIHNSSSNPNVVTGGGPSASVETQRPSDKQSKSTTALLDARAAETSSHSTPPALTAPSDLDSRRDDLTNSSDDHHPAREAAYLPAALAHTTMQASTESALLLLNQGPDSDSPMVRLPSSADAHTRQSSEVNSPSANRYQSPNSEEPSLLNSALPASSAPSGRTARTAAPAASADHPPGAAVLPAKSLFPDLTTGGLLGKKTYGPVPSVPILRAPSPASSSSSDAVGPPSPNATHVATAAAASSSADARQTLTSPPRHGGERSPTQTPRRGSTPPTSRVAQVPALNMSSVSLHQSANQPQRSASPVVGRSGHRSGGGGDGHGGVRPPSGDVVVRDSPKSSSGVLQSTSFIAATSAPTQKAIPVVRLVPAVPSDSAELAQGRSDEENDDDGEGGSKKSAPSFSAPDIRAAVAAAARGNAPLRAESERNAAVNNNSTTTGMRRNASDASYSVEAVPYDPSDDDEDALNVGQLDVYTGRSSDTMHDDIAVDQGSGHDSDPVMEDVLTEDLVQAPLFRSPLATYAAPARVPSPDTFSADSDQRLDAEKGYDQALGDDSASDERQEEAEAEEEDEDDGPLQDGAEQDDDDDEAASDDYSYYSYSYSDSNSSSGNSAPSPRPDSRSDGDDGAAEEGRKMSLSAPGDVPPMVASRMANSRADNTGEGGGGFEAGDGGDDGDSGAAVEVSSAAQKKGHSKKEKHNKTASAAVADAQGRQRASFGLPPVLSAEETGSEEVASVPQTHETSLQLNVSYTMKKAGGVFRSIFAKKKKK